MKKIITVFGATGSQGGGLAHAILDDPDSEFSVRAVTRNAHTKKSTELARKGAEIIIADIDDKASMHKALEGSYGAYFVTFFWAHFDAEKEKEQARHMALAAKAEGVQHVIWSTLEDVRKYVPLEDKNMPTLLEKYKVPHFDAKGESDHFFTDAGLPVTFLYPAFYWDNMIYFGSGPKKGADGKYSLTLPIGNKKMAGVAAEDIGKVAYGIFKKGSSLFGKYVGAAGELTTGKEMAEKLSKALNIEVSYNEVTPDQYRGFGFPGADELGNMFQFYRDFDEVCNSVRDPVKSKELNPQLLSFDKWLEKYAEKIPLE